MTQNGSTNVIAVYIHGSRRAIIRVGCKLYFEQQTFKFSIKHLILVILEFLCYITDAVKIFPNTSRKFLKCFKQVQFFTDNHELYPLLRLICRFCRFFYIL